jgi:hypothetical protein
MNWKIPESFFRNEKVCIHKHNFFGKFQGLVIMTIFVFFPPMSAFWEVAKLTKKDGRKESRDQCWEEKIIKGIETNACG